MTGHTLAAPILRADVANRQSERLRLIDINELAAQLAVSRQTLYRWRSEGHDMPAALLVGSRVRWRQGSVDDWVALQELVSIDRGL
jgi:excisionase family DNA binding protein